MINIKTHKTYQKQNTLTFHYFRGNLAATRNIQGNISKLLFFLVFYSICFTALQFYRKLPPCLCPHHPGHTDTGPHEAPPGGGGPHGQLPHVQHEVRDALAV